MEAHQYALLTFGSERVEKVPAREACVNLDGAVADDEPEAVNGISFEFERSQYFATRDGRLFMLSNPCWVLIITTPIQEIEFPAD